MIDIKNYIRESIFDNPQEIAGKDIGVKPESKRELIEIIYNEVNKYKPEETVDLNFIDTSKITDFTNLFTNIGEDNNFDISEWDVSHVKYAGNMMGGHAHFNCDLSKWDVSNIKIASHMFIDCLNFEGKGLEKCNTGKIDDMEFMFFNCKSLNVDLSNWDVSNVENMSGMFFYCRDINFDFSKWNTHKVLQCRNMFTGCKSLETKNMPTWI